MEIIFIRHEILHAFLLESGLCYSKGCDSELTTYNEMFVDWIATQFWKIHKQIIKAESLVKVN
jgi:hypothetical protein